MTPIRPPEGSAALVVWWKVCHRQGGWNAVGLDALDEIAYECLHLHDTRADGLACGRQRLTHAEGPSQ